MTKGVSMTPTTLVRPERRSPESADEALERCFQAVCTTNPFADNRVNGPDPAALDVPDIHEAPFQRLLEQVRAVASSGRAAGVLLWGEAGVGKSHLLARLGRWAEEDERAWFFYLHNLQASPENLPRALLRAVITQLTQGQIRQLHRTRLFRLVLGLISEALDHDRTRRHPWPSAVAAFERLLGRLAEEDAGRAFPVDRTIYTVLFRFFYSACRERVGHEDGVARLAIRWLSGEGLDADEARSLGLPAGRSATEPAALEDAEQIKQVLAALCRTARSSGRPFLLCFDQVDNLDRDQIASLARFLQAILDGAGNLLTVTSGVKETLLGFRESNTIQASAWDRLADERIDLHRVRAEDGRRLVAHRLRRFFSPFLDSPQVRAAVQADELFPLGETWAAEELSGKIELRPRDVLSWARERWRQEQEHAQALGVVLWPAGRFRVNRMPEQPSGSPLEAEREAATDRAVAHAVRAHQALLTQRPNLLPLDADNLSGLLAAILDQCQRCGVGGIQEMRRPDTGQPGAGFPYHLVLTRSSHDARNVRIGVRVICTDSASTTTAALRWIVSDSFSPDQIVLVTDVRRPLAFGRHPTAQGRAFFKSLQQRPAGHFQAAQLSLEEHAYLDALQEVVRKARAQELIVDLGGGQEYLATEAEVLAAHVRGGHYQTSELLRTILPLDQANRN